MPGDNQVSINLQDVVNKLGEKIAQLEVDNAMKMVAIESQQETIEKQAAELATFKEPPRE